MTLHHGYRRHRVPLREQEVPAFDYNSSSEVIVGAEFLSSLANCAGRTLADPPAQRRKHHASFMPGVLPAPFKLHKPPPPRRLPSSRCI